MSRIPIDLHAEETKTRKLSKYEEYQVGELLKKCIQTLRSEKFPMEIKLQELCMSSFTNIPQCVYLEVEKELTTAGYVISYKVKKDIAGLPTVMIINNPKISNEEILKPPSYDD